MTVKTGLTYFCSTCQKLTPCASVRLKKMMPFDRRRVFTENKLHFFLRKRKCQVCGSTFRTLEMSKAALTMYFDQQRKERIMVQNTYLAIVGKVLGMQALLPEQDDLFSAAMRAKLDEVHQMIVLACGFDAHIRFQRIDQTKDEVLVLKEVIKAMLFLKHPDGLELRQIVAEVSRMIERKELVSKAKSLTAIVCQAINHLRAERLIVGEKSHETKRNLYRLARGSALR